MNMNYFHAWGILIAGLLFLFAWPLGLIYFSVLVLVSCLQKESKIVFFQFIETFLLGGILVIISPQYDQCFWYYICWLLVLLSAAEMLYQDKKYHKEEVIL